jgi:hypothetical protein
MNNEPKLSDMPRDQKVYLWILTLLMFVGMCAGCTQENIQPKVAIGCECNDGIKLDFSKPILPGFTESALFEAKHCDGGSFTTCGVIVIILNHKGVKRYIYNPNELNNGN